MNTDSFISHVKLEDIYKDISGDVKKGFYTSNYEVDRPLPIGQNKKGLGLMKDKLGGKIITKFVGLRSKTYSYLKDNNDEGKKTKGAKGCVVKRKLKFKDYKNWLKSSQIISTVNYLEKKGINVDSFK